MRTRMSAEEELRLVALAQAGDRVAEARLVVEHLPPAYAVVNRYRYHSAVPKEDLDQEAALALLTAIRKFDPARGARLVSYAMWWVRVRVQRACRGWRYLGQEPPTQGGRWLETMPDETYRPSTVRIDLDVLSELTPGRRAAVELVLGLNGHKPHTRGEMAEALGLGEAAANKLYTRALTQLRRIVAAGGVKPDRDCCGADAERVDSPLSCRGERHATGNDGGSGGGRGRLWRRHDPDAA